METEQNQDKIESVKNISQLWLQNIYENLKNLENMERLAREGCESVFDYVQIPIRIRNKVVAEAQYKNLRLMVSEMILLLTDITPICKKEFIKGVSDMVHLIKARITHRKDFISTPINQTKGKLTDSKLLNSFYITLEKITDLRIKVIKEISPTLFVGQDMNKKIKKKEI